jgi:dTDP-4-dehydrorhamnose 3,5-epimerase
MGWNRTLSREKKLIYISEGFAHGFQTLTDNCELIFHHSQLYKPCSEAGIKYDDPAINIQWPNTLTIFLKKMSPPYLSKNFDGIKI